MVEGSIEMLIQPAAGSRLSDPACTVFSKLGRFYIASYSEGVDYAIRTGSDHVYELAERADASDVRIEVERRGSSVTVGSEHNMSEIFELILVIPRSGDRRSVQSRCDTGCSDTGGYVFPGGVPFYPNTPIIIRCFHGEDHQDREGRAVHRPW